MCSRRRLSYQHGQAVAVYGAYHFRLHPPTPFNSTRSSEPRQEEDHRIPQGHAGTHRKESQHYLHVDPCGSLVYRCVGRHHRLSTDYDDERLRSMGEIGRDG